MCCDLRFEARIPRTSSTVAGVNIVTFDFFDISWVVFLLVRLLCSALGNNFCVEYCCRRDTARRRGLEDP